MSVEDKNTLTTEIATIPRDTSRLNYGGVVLQNYDDTLLTRGAGKGLRVYDDLKRDSHVGAVLRIRSLAVIGREWTVEPGAPDTQAKQAAELVRSQLRQVGLDDAVECLLEATLKGFSVLEVMWELRNGQLAVKELLPKHQERFKFGVNRELRLLTPEAPWEGVEVPPHKFIVHRFGVMEDNPYGLGLGSSLFWPVFFKRKGITFWLSFAEKFGSPTALGKYPPGAGDTEQKKLLAALQAIAQEAGVIVPQGMDIALLEAMRSGSIDTYEKLCRYMDEQISEGVLCQTLTTNNGTGGSLAATRTHNEVRLEVAKADADRVHTALNRTLVRWIVDLNMPGAAYPETWRAFPELQNDLNAQADRDAKLVLMGFEPSESYIQQTYGGEWTRKRSALAFAEAPEEVSSAHIPEEQQAMEAMLQPVRALLAEVADLAEFRDRLLELYPDMPATPLTRLVEQACLVGNLAGRAEVLNGD